MTDQQHAIAGEVLDKALRELIDRGFDRLGAVQAMLGFGVDMLQATACKHHLREEYEELAEELARRGAAIDELVPGVDVARCTGLH
jgi:DNA phosphorothioation-dependent restriction protein DptG